MTAYSLEAQNNSSGFTNFCMFRVPDTNLGVEVVPLAQPEPAGRAVAPLRRRLFERLAANPARHAGGLYIEQGGDVPLRQAGIGIGMSGSATAAVEAQPSSYTRRARIRTFYCRLKLGIHSKASSTTNRTVGWRAGGESRDEFPRTLPPARWPVAEAAG